MFTLRPELIPPLIIASLFVWIRHSVGEKWKALRVTFFSLATVCLIFWAARLPINPPVQATASQAGGRSEVPLKTSLRVLDRQDTDAQTQTFTTSASPPSPFRNGLKDPIISQPPPGPARTAPRSSIRISPNHRPSAWVSDTQSLSRHWWWMLLTDKNALCLLHFSHKCHKM